jgi:O-antigen/teichoic acid export membrane protein
MLLLATSLIGVLAVTLLRNLVVSLLLAERYRESARLIPYFAAGLSLWGLSLTFEKVFHARQRTKSCLIVRTAGALLSVAVGAPMIYRFGTMGAAWSVPLYYGGQLLICLLLVVRGRQAPG